VKRKFIKMSSLVMAGALGASVLLTGCADAGKVNDNKPRSTEVMEFEEESNVSASDISEACMTSGYEMLIRNLEQADENSNVMISPVSISLALEMAAMGAEGDTYDQMAEILGNGASKYDFDEYVQDYMKSIKKDKALVLANSIWLDENRLEEKNYVLSDEYMNLMEDHFKAGANSVDFKDKDTVDLINEWVADNTDDMIDEVIDGIDDNTMMYLINAACFEGTWAKEYTEYQIDKNGIFTNANGKEEHVTMLNSTEGYLCYSDNATGFLKYYDGDRYAFMAILPDDESLSLQEFSELFSEDEFVSFYNNSTIGSDVIAKMPVFSFDYDVELNEVLEDMGMEDAFSGNKADFSSMAYTTDDDHNLCIGSVIHKTHIELDEKGTKAAAVTVVEMKDNEACAIPDPSEPVEVILDRPFMFAIMDTEYDVPVFIGAVNTVE